MFLSRNQVLESVFELANLRLFLLIFGLELVVVQNVALLSVQSELRFLAEFLYETLHFLLPVSKSLVLHLLQLNLRSELVPSPLLLLVLSLFLNQLIFQSEFDGFGMVYFCKDFLDFCSQFLLLCVEFGLLEESFLVLCVQLVLFFALAI